MTFSFYYCRRCQRETRFVFAGHATGDARENTTRPRGELWRCWNCGFERLALADAGDVKGLCRWMLDKHLRRTGAGSVTELGVVQGGTSGHGGDGKLDFEDALLELHMVVWHAYLQWDGRGTFTGFATMRLDSKLKRWYERQLGRGKGQKPEAAATSLQSDYDFGLVRAGGRDAGGREGEPVESRTLGEVVAAGQVESAADRDPTFLRALLSGPCEDPRREPAVGGGADAEAA